MVPELPVAMLACARLGAAHSVVFGGFTSDSLRDRINDAECKVLITGDGAWRRGNVVPLKEIADAAMAETPIDRAVPRAAPHRPGRRRRCRRAATSGGTTSSTRSRPTCPPEPMDAEDLLFILYTSGTTGKPKGIMHTTGGYLTQVAFTHKYVFDLHPDTDVFWCTADCGWVTGHSYIVYGPLANRATSVMYEGTPDYPGQGPLLVDRREVQGHDALHRADRDPHVHEVGHAVLRRARPVVAAAARIGRRADQPRGLGLVLEEHRRRALPGGRHVVADRDRRHHDQPAARAPPSPKPGSATFPLPGHRRRHRERRGGAGRRSPAAATSCSPGPWPSMLRGIWGDPERYRDTYWSRFDGRYFAGDGAKRDDDGYFWLLGRVDDIMLVAGHNISTTEVESALVSHPAVAEAAVVGRTDETTGQAVSAFVILRGGNEPTEALVAELRDHVGARHRPDREAEDDPVHRGPAEDPLGQDHAPAPAQRRRGRVARRHHDARRPERRRGHQGAVPVATSTDDEG